MNGHYLLRDGAPVYDDHGKNRERRSRFYVGRAKCECGALSDKGICKADARKWFAEHRDSIAPDWVTCPTCKGWQTVRDAFDLDVTCRDCNGDGGWAP